MKFTRTAYTDLSVKEVLAELVHACDLKTLPNLNANLNARHNLALHPDMVRVTITVERTTPRVEELLRQVERRGRP